MSSINLQTIFENNRQWAKKKLAEDSEYFKKLSAGQNPDILYIGCSDSRVSAEELMGLKPGEVFVHRNIANMVPNNDLSVMSIINYAVDVLQVDKIVVVGHYQCGGVHEAMQSKDLGLINPWLRNIRDVFRLHKDELNDIIDEDLQYRRLIELNVQEQCVNVIKTAAVQRANKQRGLTVHGWVFDLHTGRLIDLNINFAKILADIMEIYRIV